MKDVFPFLLREVERYYQLAEILSAVAEWLQDLAALPASGVARRFARQLRKCLNTLEDLLAPVVNDPATADLVAKLERANAAFCAVRKVLGTDGKSSEEVRADMHALLADLAQDPANADICGELEWRLEEYDRELYVTYDHPDIVPRTNNDLESFNKEVKRPIRKCRGQKDSWFFLEHEGAGVAAYHNLLPEPRVVGGTKIADHESRCPLERAGVIKDLTVPSIMSLVNYEQLVEALATHDAGYAVHRWTRRINKRGMHACLQDLTEEWKASLRATKEGENELQLGGETSGSL